MPRVYPCEHCNKIIDEDDNDKYVAVQHRIELSGPARKTRVHAGCWDEYRKKFEYSELDSN